MLVFGKVNFTNLSRYSNFSERTYRRQFSQEFEFVKLNQGVIEQAIPKASKKIAAIDCSFIPKSGKKTYGKDYFYNGTTGRSEQGLEISVVAVIDVDSKAGYTLSVVQTPAQDKTTSGSSKAVKSSGTDQRKQKTSKETHSRGSSKGKKDKEIKLLTEETRIDLYLKQVQETIPYLDREIRYLVADGYYAKFKFVSGIVALQLDMIGKLRIDANLRYLYTGEQKPLGRKRKYGDKVQLCDLPNLTYVQEIEPGVKLYTAMVWHVSLKRSVRIAYLMDQRNPNKVGQALLFSTDTDIDPYELYCYYKARFQIEFIFRDAKQFTGLADCQSCDQHKLNFHFNASLSALNLAKLESKNQQSDHQPFSMATHKRLALNDHLLELFITNLDLEPEMIKNHPNYQKLRSYGAIAA